MSEIERLLRNFLFATRCAAAADDGRSLAHLPAEDIADNAVRELAAALDAKRPAGEGGPS